MGGATGSGGRAAGGARTATGRAAALALARRGFRDGRIRTISFAYVFAAYSYIQPVGYRHSYPTAAGRLAFAHSFAHNGAIRLFYGEPHDLLTVSGYTAWRVGGTLAIAAAVFGVLSAVRALRSEEEAGRMELVLAGPVGRASAFAAALAGILGGILILWLASAVGYVVGGLPVAGSAYLSLATASVAAVFVGVGAVAAQLAPTRRGALELGSTVVAVFLLLRVVADTAAGAGWLRWVTPLGWAEEMRPFTGARPLVFAIPIVVSALLLVLAARIALARDVGTGILPARDTAPARLALLSSPTAQALRSERGSFTVWAGCFAVFAVILGAIAPSVSSAGITPTIRRELAKLGSGSILTPSGYLAFVFIFFILAVCLFTCSQVAAAWHEEAEGRLETQFALPIGRVRWLLGRLLLAAGGAIGLSLIAALVSWAGASSQGVHIALPRMLDAGANCLPIALLFLGLAAMAYAVSPRASAGISYGLVMVAFLWYLVGSVTGAPKWLVEATPFAHIGFVPTQPFRLLAALIMAAGGALAMTVALAVFGRRDVIGG